MSSIGRYEVVERLGAGGFATVYLVRDPVLDSEVAAKVLADNWSGSVEVRDRFVREAQLLRRIDSNRVVTVHDIGELASGQPYFVMSLANRGTLESRLKQLTAAPTAQEVSVVAQEVAECLHAVHDHELIHRDIKPSNLLITGNRPNPEGDSERPMIGVGERLVLGDFGLAKDIAFQATGVTIAAGTGGYAAPEQMSPSGGPDRQTDLYAATAVMYRVVTNTSPPAFDFARNLVPFPDSEWWMAGRIGQFFRRGMTFNQHDRHSSAEEWLADFVGAYGGGQLAGTHGSAPQQPPTGHDPQSAPTGVLPLSASPHSDPAAMPTAALAPADPQTPAPFYQPPSTAPPPATPAGSPPPAPTGSSPSSAPAGSSPPGPPSGPPTGSSPSSAPAGSSPPAPTGLPSSAPAGSSPPGPPPGPPTGSSPSSAPAGSSPSGPPSGPPTGSSPSGAPAGSSPPGPPPSAPAGWPPSALAPHSSPPGPPASSPPPGPASSPQPEEWASAPAPSAFAAPANPYGHTTVDSGFRDHGGPPVPIGNVPNVAVEPVRRRTRWSLFLLGGLVLLMVAAGALLLANRGPAPTVIGPDEVVAGELQQFSATFDGADGFRWIDWDGQISEGETFELRGIIPGTIRFEVEAITAGSTSRATTHAVLITPAADAPVIVGPPEIRVGVEESFTFESDGATNPEWIDANGPKQGEVYRLTGTKPGPFEITLVVTRPDGVTRVGARRTIQIVE